MFVLALLGLVGLAGGATLLLKSPQGSTPPPAQPAVWMGDEQPEPPPATAGKSASSPPPQARQGTPAPAGKSPLQQMGEAGLVGAIGAGIGFIAGVGANDTKEAKQAAPMIGAGLALGAYFANVGGAFATGGLAGTLAGVSIIAAPLLVATFSITVVVDQILRAVKNGQWAAMAKKVRELRLAGKYREALAVYQETAPSIPEISRVWPKPGEDWWGYDDPQRVGRPYPGFPGPPKGASQTELRAHPEQCPDTINTADGSVLEVRRLLDAAYKDAEDARAAVLATKAPGLVVVGKSTQEATQGPRDVRAQQPYKDLLATADGWALKLAEAFAWFEPRALVRDVRDAAEKAVDSARAAAFQADQAAAVATRAARLSDETTATKAATAATRGRGIVPPPVAVAQNRAAGMDTAATRKTSTGAAGATDAPTSGRGSQTNTAAARNRPGGDL